MGFRIADPTVITTRGARVGVLWLVGVGVLFIAVGLRGRDTEAGRLTSAAGVLLLVSLVQTAGHPATRVLGNLAGAAMLAVLGHLALAVSDPDEAPRTAMRRWTVVAGYAVNCVAVSVWLGPAVRPIPVVAASALLLYGLWLAALVFRRWLTHPESPRRQALAVTAVVGIPMVLLLNLREAAVVLAPSSAPDPPALTGFLDAAELALLAGWPIGIVAGVLRSRLAAALTEVQASRARVVQAADAERRRIERDLHDGAQLRLSAVAALVGRARLAAGRDSAVAPVLEELAEELRAAARELRELAQGVFPAVLAESGLGPALVWLAQRCPVPVEVHIDLPAPAQEDGPVERAGYFVAAEALANVVKHADAHQAWLTAVVRGDQFTLEIADDGNGGLSVGGGLAGLADRVAALNGRIEFSGRPGNGSRVALRLPLRGAAQAHDRR